MRGSNFRYIVLDSPSSLSQHCKHCLDAFLGGALDLGVVDRLHHPWAGCQERRIEGSAGCRNDLSWWAVHGRFCNFSIDYSKLHISHGLVTKWAFSSAPSESLNHALFDSIQRVLAGAGAHKRIVDKGISTVVLRSKGPNVIGGQLIPAVL